MLPKIYAALFVFALSFITQSAQAQCTTSAGTINIANALVCEGSPFAIVANNDAVLDGNDIRRFVAFTGGTPNAGNALAVSTTGAFSWQPNFPVGSPLFVAAVAANDAGGGQLDWNDPCLSVSGVITVVYQAKPKVTIQITCGQQSTALVVNPVLQDVTYRWFEVSNISLTVGSGSTLSFSTPGEFSVTATNVINGCSTNATPIVFTGVSPITAFTSVKNVSCAGAADGQIVLDLHGGVAPYTYNIGSGGAVVGTGTGDSILVIGNLTAGSYAVTIIDANGCSATRNAVITQPAPITVSTGNALVDCSGQANLTATASGGTLPYTFLWSNGATTQASGPISGLVSVTVTDANGCTAATLPVTIVAQAPVSATASNPVPSGCNTNNGTLALNTMGGTPPYAYKWSNTANTQNLQNLGAGTYLVTVTDERGCTVVAKGIVLDGVSNTVLDATPSPVSCNGGTNGSAHVVITGGSGNFTMNWSNGGASPTATSLVAGTYTVTVLDVPSGCTAQASVVVKEPQPLMVSGDAQACGGALTLLVSGGTPAYAYLWSNNATTQNLSGLPLGIYTVTVRDANNCTATRSFSIQTLPSVSINATATAATCAQANGTVTIDVTSGDIGPYSYSWFQSGAFLNGNASSKVFTIANLPSGNYVFTVSNADGCTGTTSVQVPASSPINLTAVPTGGCGQPGSITVTTSGGAPPYTYQWSNAATTQNLSGLSAGTYMVTVRDANGCSKVSPSIVIGTLAPAIFGSNTKDPDCDSKNGFIILSSAEPLNYLWNDGSTAPARVNLDSGTYIVKATHIINGCMSIDTFKLKRLGTLSITGVVSPAQCNQSNGAIQLSLTGAVGPFDFVWSNGSTTQNQSGLTAGLYTVSINGSGTCGGTTASFQVRNLNLSVQTTPVSCNGGSDGAISLTVSGGSGAYVFRWSNNAATQNISGLSAGIYTITVTDALGGCSATITATVGQPQPLLLNENIQFACNGSTNGSIDLSVLGGTPGYIYVWSNGASTSSINNLAAGIYSVTVTDARGCTAVKSMTVLQSSNLMITLSSTPAGCLANSGSITATISGGVPPYTSQWSNGATTFTINNLSVGAYTITVSDALGCTATATGLVQSTTGSILLSTAVTPTACNANTGAINLTAVGGPNLAYLWNNGSTTEDLSGLSAGTYGVTVTDLTSGCTATTSATVTSNGNALNISTAVTPVSCFGLSNGALDLNVSGGTGPYIYLWSNGSTNQAINNLSAGTYTVTVRDVNFCSSVTSVVITQPPVLSAFTYIITPTTCPACPNGGITGSSIGGTLPIAYLWSNNTTAQDLNNVLPGTYTLMVTDANGCTATDQASIPVSCGLPGLSFLPNGVPNEPCGTAPNGAITFNFWGDPGPYDYQWSNGTTTGSGSTLAAPMNITGLTAGLYTVTVNSANGACFVTEVEVKNGNPGSLGFSLQSYAATCSGGVDGGLTVEVQPRFEVPPYSYTWTGGGATGNGSNILTEPFNIANLPAGQYSVTVTNSAGCSAQRTGSIGAQNVFFTSTATAAACTGNPNGQITLSVNGTLAPYTYQWSNGVTTGNGNFNGTTAVLSNLTAGTYNITVTNAAGCTAVGTRLVQQGNMAFSTATVQAAACAGGANGAFSINVDNAAAVAPYAYTWSNGSANGSNGNINAEPFTLSGLSAGTYQLTVTNGAGCTATSTFNLPTQFPPSIAITATSPACYGGVTGQLRLSISTNVAAPYTYSWSNGTASGNGTAPGTPFFITNLAAGNYVVTVTNGNGCSNIATATLTQPNQPVVSFIQKEPSCFGQSNGSIVSTYFGANAPYAYKWVSSNGLTSTAPNLINIPAGTYQLTVTNSLGCSYSPAPIILGQPAELTATAGSSGCGSASAAVVAQGGTTPYAYLWSNGATTATLSNVAAGVYGVTVRDAKSCSAVDAVLVQPGGTTCSVIKGFVRQDLNSNCVSDGEPGLVGWYVMAESATGTYFATTDATGEYRMRVPPGTYSLNAVAPAPVWELCPAGGLVSVNQPLDTAMNADLLAKRKALCPALSVNIGTGFLRRCFDNYYTVEYCNNGTAPAENAYVVVKLDPFLIFKSASIPNQAIGGNQFRFAVGNLGIGECGTFSLKANLSCASILGQTHCTEAHIYPDTLCLPFLAQWSGASLELDSRCAPDSLRFVLKNKGTGDMDQVAEYIIIEDHVMLRQMPFQLAAGDSMVIGVPANGHSWRLEAPQVPFHPTLSRPILSVEGCKSTAGAFSTGFVSQFPVNDADPWIDIDCQVNVGAYDPNDKQGFPLGYGPKHYVRPGTELDYLIRFQNTGTDTAFNVVVLDTLSKWLDPCTVRPGASSHAYQFELYGPGILRFVFPNILLPDSTTNEVASHGYVKFRISPQADAPLETVVENRAAIYFDFNEPVITNTADHRLGVNFVTTSLWRPNMPLAEVELSPNPFGTEAVLRIKGLQTSKDLQLRIFDLGGQLVREMESDQAAFTLKRGDLPEGMYLYRVEQNGKWVGSGKMVVQ